MRHSAVAHTASHTVTPPEGRAVTAALSSSSRTVRGGTLSGRSARLAGVDVSCRGSLPDRQESAFDPLQTFAHQSCAQSIDVGCSFPATVSAERNTLASNSGDRRSARTAQAKFSEPVCVLILTSLKPKNADDRLQGPTTAGPKAISYCARDHVRRTGARVRAGLLAPAIGRSEPDLLGLKLFEDEC